MRFIGLIVMFVMLAMTLAEQGHLLFLQLEELVFLVGFAIAGTLAADGFGAGWLMLRTVSCRRRESLDAKAIAQARRVLTHLHRFIWAAAILLVALAVVLTLQNLDDPSMVGPGMAYALCPLLHAAVLAEFVVGPLLRGLPADGEGVGA